MLNSNRQSWHLLGRNAPLNNNAPGVNWDVLICTLALLAIGSVMVFSATSLFEWNSRLNVEAFHYLIRHLISITLGLTACLIVYSIPMRIWFRMAPWICFGSLLLLVLVLVPGVAKVINGARRWINLGFFNLQVSETMKVAALLMAAWFTVKRQNYMHSWRKGFLPMAMGMMMVAFLLMQQPDLGATVVIGCEILGVLFLGGLGLHIFVSVATVLIFFVIWMIFNTPWRFERFMAYLHPWDKDHVLEKGYQLSHSLIAIGRGEFFGVGLGGSVEKLYYLPEAHTDFIFAVIAEELGFVGVVLVLFLYYWLIRYCFEIGRQAVKLERYFQGMVAQGVGLWFGIQTVINIGVASGVFPTKGLTLPLISFGGTAILSGLVAIGLVLRVDKENKILMRGGQV